MRIFRHVPPSLMCVQPSNPNPKSYDGGKNEWSYVSSPERAQFTSLLLDKIDHIHVISGGADGRLRHWHLQQTRHDNLLPMELVPCSSIAPHSDEVTRLHVSSQAVVYSISKDCSVYAWDIRSGRHSAVACFSAPVLCLSLGTGSLALGTAAGNVAHLAWQDPARDAMRRNDVVKKAYPQLEQQKEEKKQRLSVVLRGVGGEHHTTQTEIEPEATEEALPTGLKLYKAWACAAHHAAADH